MEILLVDDDDELRGSLSALLETGGARVTAVRSADAALERLAARRFDRLVTDFEMPGMDGAALIAAVRRSWPRLPVVLLSARPEAAEHAAYLGVQYLAKPVTAATLLATVQRSTPPTGPERPASGPVTVAVRPRSARRRTPPWAWTVAAAALVAVGLFFAPFAERAPELPAPPPTGVMRGASIEPLEPTGPLAETPRQLRWQAPDDAVRHRVVFEHVDGRLLFSQLVERRTDETGVVVFDLPSAVADNLEPMVVYHWWVESLDATDNPLARSNRARFRILAPLGD